MLERVSKSGSIIAASPYATSHIKVSKASVKREMPISVPDTPIGATTHLDAKAGIRQAAYVEVAEVQGGTVKVDVVPEFEWPDQCPIDIFGGPNHGIDTDPKPVEEFFQSERDEPIEWTGSPQKTSSDRVRKRAEVFKEDDVRGSRNDLLGGHL